MSNHDSNFNYDTEPEDAEPAQHWCVAIFHNDPGTANYGNVNPLILRGCGPLLSWILAWTFYLIHNLLLLLLQEAIDLHNKYHRIAKSAELTTSLNQARDALNEYRANDARGMYSDFISSLNSR